MWGEVVMAAHPDLAEGDAQQIVSWILSLANKEVGRKSLPATGIITPPSDLSPNSVLVLSARYTDKGGNNIKALTGTKSISLPGSTVPLTGKTKTQGFALFNYGGRTIMLSPAVSGWFAFSDMDLTGVRAANIMVGWQGDMKVGFTYEAHLDAPDGKLIGKGSMPIPKKGQQFGFVPVKLDAITDGKNHELYFTFKSQDPGQASPSALMSVQFK